MPIYHHPLPLQALSSVGRCKSLDATADGYGRAEGVATLVLSPHQEALQGLYGHSVAVVCGSCINQGGRSSGLTAPNGPAQSALVQAAIADAHVHYTQIDLVSIHGTGTALGDPIEVGALGTALSDATLSSDSKPRATTLVSSKSCFGHTEGTAGITGLLLSISIMQKHTSPPVTNLRSLNPYVEAALGSLADKRSRSGMRAMRQAAPAHLDFSVEEKTVSKMLAGCSSFGMSGINAHIITSQHDEMPTLRKEQCVRENCPAACPAITDPRPKT